MTDTLDDMVGAQSPDDLAAMSPETYVNPAANAAFRSTLSLPRRAIESAAIYQQTGQYDPAPIVEAATLPMGAGAIAGVPMRAGEMALGAGPIRAYHGSPHSFDKFDISKIGTGEGADAYGRGLYFSENPQTAEFYKAATEHKGTSPTSYEVNINADVDRFINWDKPLSEQSSFVQDYAKRLGVEGDPAGSELQNAFANKVLNSELEKRGGVTNWQSITAQEARDLPQQHMVGAGIPGVKFQGASAPNYVVFDDKLIDIVKKYALAGFALPPAIQAAYNQQFHPVDHDPFAGTQKLVPVDHDPFVGIK